jgi:type II secretory pathway pseudopilin PulG
MEQSSSQPVVKANKKPKVIIIALILVALLSGLALGYYSGRISRNTEISEAKSELAGLKDYQARTQKYFTENGTPVDQNSYLTIKEWGLKIPLDSKFTDLTYSIKPSGNDYLNGTTLRIVSPKLAKGSTCKDYSGEVATIVHDSGNPEESVGATSVTIGEIKYFLKLSNDTCAKDQVLANDYSYEIKTQFPKSTTVVIN